MRPREPESLCVLSLCYLSLPFKFQVHIWEMGSLSWWLTPPEGPSALTRREGPWAGTRYTHQYHMMRAAPWMHIRHTATRRWSATNTFGGRQGNLMKTASIETAGATQETGCGFAVPPQAHVAFVIFELVMWGSELRDCAFEAGAGMSTTSRDSVLMVFQRK